MQPNKSLPASFLIPLAATAYVVLTSRALPPVVASHFDGGGAANGFMSRQFYIWFMLAFVVGIPLLLVVLPNLALRHTRIPFNLPNRDFWLAPDRRQETVEFLCRHNARFGILLTVFLCYVHWLVIRANAVAPPTLSSAMFIVGLTVFALLSIAWLGALLGRFRKVPPPKGLRQR